jgi:hypothetical protein
VFAPVQAGETEIFFARLCRRAVPAGRAASKPGRSLGFGAAALARENAFHRLLAFLGAARSNRAASLTGTATIQFEGRRPYPRTNIVPFLFSSSESQRRGIRCWAKPLPAGNGDNPAFRRFWQKAAQPFGYRDGFVAGVHGVKQHQKIKPSSGGFGLSAVTCTGIPVFQRMLKAIGNAQGAAGSGI